jgi:ATP:cob(I)alamin adenosyltransferase
VPAYELIRRKRDGEALEPGAFGAFLRGFQKGKVPDYQMAALLMAIYYRGLSPAELDTLVRAILESGRVVDFGGQPGRRVDKHELRVEAYGTVDELCSVLSLARLSVQDEALRKQVREVQRFLFTVGADLATPISTSSDPGKQVRRVGAKDVEALEQLIDQYWARVDALDRFIVPGETPAAAHLHVARTVCRGTAFRSQAGSSPHAPPCACLR